MSGHSSFLPEDYLAKKAETRTNIIALVLFAVVMLAVFLAFIVTNKKWSAVMEEQASINAAYQQADRKIIELHELEHQKKDMLQRAELASALVERVPRSILLAELVNRMPERLSLLNFEMKSERIKTVKRDPKTKDAKTGRLAPKRGKTKADSPTSANVEAPRYRVEITLKGVAPTDLEVSEYLTALKRYTLIDDVRLQHSMEQQVDEQIMREFEITMNLDSRADVRNIEPLIVPRGLQDTTDIRLGSAEQTEIE